ncbi:MAG: F0F1 ATP synthase subunit alpha [Candidatus Sungbacteria bacterium RIFCSPHIGHO2_02_FULL_53_17]|uniref:ATP synthase subunit alpha n=1 Tax=Candidatus Sungbacteria bacterium RIFCSPHIGHO2_02_FULL_53_17 TaxID=1802275 RepID=A0A1G2KXD9_9BACT|nr:MAG: F0F1 ATP synthase subunit alpha [Candidatus Sungbacteria bacterium RIFCSPHIGHO2_02_FULL_53_17]
MTSPIIEGLKKELEGLAKDVKPERIGRVLEIGDGIARIYGLSGVASQEMLSFETAQGTVEGIAFNLEEDTVGAIVLGDYTKIKEGDVVRQTNRVLSVRVGDALIGRVVGALGEPLDGRGPIFKEREKEVFYPAERPAPSVTDREPVNIPLHTGIMAIDAMIPVGRGQRELIIGDRQIGKTSIAIDAILNQARDSRYPTPVCIYVAIGQKESKVAKIVATLKEKGAMDYTIVVSAPASAPAPLWYLAPYSAAAIGEYFMHQGRDALVIYDDLSKHAWGYREISLLLRRPPGREAYPGDIFYLHSRLLERAAKLSKEKGGGSLTALPIIETQLGDVSAYIPTNVISITDGQIYLEPELFYQGVRPALNVGLSVSRVGSAAQTKAMKKVAGRLRLELAQFRELAAFVQFASELDEGTKKRIERGRVLTELLKQSELDPIPFEKQVIAIYAGTHGYFDDVLSADVPATCAALLDYIEKLHRADILDTIRETGDLTKETEEKLKTAIDDFKKLSI